MPDLNSVSVKGTKKTCVRVGYFGPSTADNYMYFLDMEKMNMTFPAVNTAYDYARGDKFYLCQNGYSLRACAGLTGESITQAYARFAGVAGINRKSAYDLANAKPDIIVYRSCAINDIQGYSDEKTVEYITPFAEKEIAMAKYFTERGIPVIFTPVLGYSAPVSQALLDVRRDAVLKFNAIYRAINEKNIYFCEAENILYDNTGAYLPNMSDDGIHLSRLGGAVYGRREYAIAQKLVSVNKITETSFYDGCKSFAGGDSVYSASGSAGGVLTTEYNGSERKQYKLVAPANGKASFVWLWNPATLFAINSVYEFIHNVKIYDENMNHISWSNSIIQQVRAQSRRTTGNIDLMFDVLGYKNGEINSVICQIPNEAITLVQTFSTLTFETAGTYYIDVNPMLAYKLS